MRVPLTTFYSYNPLGEKRHLSLHPIQLVDTELQPCIGQIVEYESKDWMNGVEDCQGRDRQSGKAANSK